MPRYIIHAVESGAGDGSAVVRKVFEAPTGDDARSMAHAIGLEVRAVEVDDDTPSRREDGDPPSVDRSDPFSSPTSDDPRDRAEEVRWTGSPSQWMNFWWFVLCLLVIPIPVAIWKYLGVRATVFEITTQRFKYRYGVVSQSIDEIELYRVKDTELTRSLADRVLGLGTIVVISSDETMPRLEMKGIAGAEGVREVIRKNVEAVRRARGVRELDVS
ncbi:MAG: PH domain-containing protein [Planctomycetota bacterium]